MNKNNNFIYHFAIFLFSSIGIFLTYRMHLLSTLNQECSSGSCLAVFESFSLFGISNIYIGMLHYSILTGLGLASIFLKKSIHKKLILIRNAMIVFGFLYSMFLISYIVFGDIGFCELCLYSASISSILFILAIKSGIRNTSVKVKGSMKYLYITSISIIIFLIISHNPEEHIDSKPKKISIAKSVVLGNPNAKITITEFTDFQ